MARQSSCMSAIHDALGNIFVESVLIYLSTNDEKTQWFMYSETQLIMD